MLRNLRHTLVRLLEDAELIDDALRARNRIRSWWARIGRLVRPELARRQFANQLDEDHRLQLAPTRFGYRLARRRFRRTVVDIMQANREVVVGMLEAQGIPYSLVPVESKNRYRVAVPAEKGDEILRGLGQQGSAVYVYLDEGLIPTRQRLVSGRDLARSPRLRRRAWRSPVWRVFQYYVDDADYAMGDLYGCEIELWTRDDERGHLHAARWNRLVDTIPERRFGKERVQVGGHFFRVTGDTYLHRDPETPDFPVDLVYTWVDGSDPDWIERRAATFRRLDLAQRNEDAVSRARYESHDELRYSLRSVEQYADFVRHIYIVTDRQRPEWLVDDHPGLTVVDHSEIIDPELLPTFNSHAIESRLHRIDGLSEHYVYMNDDFFFGRRVGLDRFFHSNGVAKFFFSRAHIPLGEATVATKPVDAAAMNGRQLVWEEFGFMPRRKFKHAPYPQRRSVHEELEKRFPDAVARTTASQVRSPTDLAMASSLHHYMAYGLGLAVPGPIDSQYVDLGEPNLEGRLWDLRQDRNYDVLCLNDNDGAELSPEQQGRMATELLEALFPIASAFEIRKDAP